MKRLGAWTIVAAVITCGTPEGGHRARGQQPAAEWPLNGGVDNIRYSPLAQINRDNVTSLKVAWTYDSHDSFTGSEMQSNPIVVGGVLYATTPTDAAGIARPHPRLRCEDRQGAVDLPHHPEAG